MIPLTTIVIRLTTVQKVLKLGMVHYGSLCLATEIIVPIVFINRGLPVQDGKLLWQEDNFVFVYVGSNHPKIHLHVRAL